LIEDSDYGKLGEVGIFGTRGISIAERWKSVGEEMVYEYEESSNAPNAI
jgi:hypothetical protein